MNMPDDPIPAVTTTKTVVEASPVGEPPKVRVITTTTSPLHQLGNWTAGIVGAFISGAAAAISAGLAGMAVDSQHFNLHGQGLKDTLELAGATALISGIVSLAKYLTIHPVPLGWDGVDRRGD